MKKTKGRHPNLAVKELRTALGYNQAGFATLAGVSLDTVKSWESPSRCAKISPEVARRIALATGADKAGLLSGRKGLKDFRDAPYTGAWFEQWKTRYSTRAERDRLGQYGGEYLTALLQAAARAGVPVPTVYQSFVDWLEDARRDFGLVEATEAELRQMLQSDPREKGKDTYPAWHPAGFGGLKLKPLPART
jgi:transcriptional regulator with XRE-family HTH domain